MRKTLVLGALAVAATAGDVSGFAGYENVKRGEGLPSIGNKIQIVDDSNNKNEVQKG